MESALHSAARNSTDAHRPLREEHDLAAILSHIEQRTISNDTIQFRGQRYQIPRSSVRIGMRGEKIRVEVRLDGSTALRYQGQYLSVEMCGQTPKQPRGLLPITTEPARRLGLEHQNRRDSVLASLD